MDDIAMTVYRKVGSRIREVRVKSGMSQADLSVKANISLPHISDIELGKTRMKLDTLCVSLKHCKCLLMRCCAQTSRQSIASTKTSIQKCWLIAHPAR